MRPAKLEAPFPYFGGKAKIAPRVWQALGSPRQYMEPFFGSGAVLLARPGFDPQKHTETVVDSDGFVCNVWRSLQLSPDETARWCDWPVNHIDLMARKRELIKNEASLVELLVSDPKAHNPILAGYWIWAASCWIGAGLTSPTKIPHLSNTGAGVHKISQIPHLSDAGKGVHKISQIPHLSNTGKGVQEPYNTNLYAWFRQLSERLRHVRVVCGDWSRVCGGNWQDKLGDVGIFFDPPYGVADRDQDIYSKDSLTVAQDVNAWCFERGKLKDYRIVLAGYLEEHQNLLDAGWTGHRYSAGGGYGNTAGGDSQGKKNRHREMLYFSPHCVGPGLLL